MKIAISSMGEKLESSMDQRFGRAAFLIIADTESMEYEALNNTAATAAGGAGIIAAQAVVEKGVTAVITGNAGPNAMSVLQAAKVPVFRGSPVDIRENIELFKRGILQQIDTTVPAHSGMRVPEEEK